MSTPTLTAWGFFSHRARFSSVLGSQPEAMVVRLPTPAKLGPTMVGAPTAVTAWHPTHAFAAKMTDRTKLVVVSNLHNPTGVHTPLEVLADIIGSIHAIGSLSLLDVKRGDIGSTNEGYATGLLGPDSAMAADSITVHAYLGFNALSPNR